MWVPGQPCSLTKQTVSWLLLSQKNTLKNILIMFLKTGWEGRCCSWTKTYTQGFWARWLLCSFRTPFPAERGRGWGVTEARRTKLHLPLFLEQQYWTKRAETQTGVENVENRAATPGALGCPAEALEHESSCQRPECRAGEAVNLCCITFQVCCTQPHSVGISRHLQIYLWTAEQTSLSVSFLL